MNMADKYDAIYEKVPEPRVLIVDDSVINRKIFCSALGDKRIQITEAESGEKCLEEVRQTSYDIIFMDHMMPEMDGIETFREMKRMKEYPSQNAAVVLFTANTVEDMRQQCLQEGFQAYFSKPIDAKKLEHLIDDLLNKKVVEPILPIINGLDWDYARMHFTDEKSMLSTVKLFASMIDYDARELENLFVNIGSEYGRMDFCTKVHSMKNSASIIGIVPLAGMAKILEDAAKENEQDILTIMTPVLLKYWRSYKGELQVLSDKNRGESQTKKDTEEIESLFAQIKSVANTMDPDITILDELLRKLEEYEFQEEQAVRFEQIKKAIVHYDIEFLQNI